MEKSRGSWGREKEDLVERRKKRRYRNGEAGKVAELGIMRG